MKIDETSSVIGIVTTNMNHRFLAPTVGGTMAEVASFLNSTQRADNSTPKLTRKLATHVQTLLVASLENQIKP
jgi:acyl-coenzyme A thioesterase PaaI-like protein